MNEFVKYIDQLSKDKDLSKMDSPGYAEFLADIQKLTEQQLKSANKNNGKKDEILKKLLADIESLINKKKLNESIYIVNGDIVGELLGFLFENRPLTPGNRGMAKRSDSQTHDQIMGILFNEADPEPSSSENKSGENAKPEENKSEENKPGENKSAEAGKNNASSTEKSSGGESSSAGGSTENSSTDDLSKGGSSGNQYDDDDDDDSTGTNLYIIPMPGLKYPDDEDTWTDND